MSNNIDTKYFDENGKLNDLYFKDIRRHARFGEVDGVKQMLEGVDIDQISQYKYPNGRTLLMDVVSSGREEILDVLIQKKVDLNVKDDDGNTAFDYVGLVFDGDKQKRMIIKLSEAGAVDHSGERKSDFEIAIMKQDTEAIKDLASKGVDINKEIKKDKHFWDRVVHNSDMMKTLVDVGADFDIADADGHTALMKALYLKKEETADILLNAGVNVNTKMASSSGFISGYTALHFSCSAEMVQKLIDKGADVNATDADGITPIMCQSVDGMRLLYKAGAKTDVKSEGQTLMGMAAACQNIEKIKFLKEIGLDINESDDYGLTPLEYAVMDKKSENKGSFILTSGRPYVKFARANSEFVQQMLDEGAKISSTNALSYVGNNLEGEKIRALLDKTLEDETRQTLSVMKKDEENAKILQDHLEGLLQKSPATKNHQSDGSQYTQIYVQKRLNQDR